MLKYRIPDNRINDLDYEDHFTDYLRTGVIHNAMTAAKSAPIGYEIPAENESLFDSLLDAESLFRRIASVKKFYHSDGKITTDSVDCIPSWVREDEEIPENSLDENFDDLRIGEHKLAVINTISNSLLSDATFDIVEHLMKKLSRGFGKKETEGFINGDGKLSPVGILHPTEGAEVFKSVAAITYDDVIDFYFSLKSDYRTKGVWLMNDVTALALKKLKDADGNYLWKGDDSLLLGKKVEITDAMPNGTISFGDFSYYWVIPRKKIYTSVLKEKYAIKDKTGYRSYEFIDGRLTKREAVKTLKTTATV